MIFININLKQPDAVVGKGKVNGETRIRKMELQSNSKLDYGHTLSPVHHSCVCGITDPSNNNEGCYKEV